MKYIALLRGINVGGKNPVAMSDLRASFEALGFTNVQTYINSGNVIFDSEKIDKVALVGLCEKAIQQKVGFLVACSVIRADELHSALKQAPSWWGVGDNTMKHNVLFPIAPATAE